VLDSNLATVAEAEDRAEAVLRHAAVGASDGAITVHPNCGGELYDVIEVTDAAGGMAAAKRRVVGQALRFSAERGEYAQHIEFGGM
jgi:hypothetical protein